jgi:hypothetical protein
MRLTTTRVQRKKRKTKNQKKRYYIVSMPEVVGRPNPVARKEHTAGAPRGLDATLICHIAEGTQLVCTFYM